MSKVLRREMDAIRTELLSLFGVVEQMVDKSVRALCDRRVDLAQQVIDTDEVVDNREVRIEEECLKILALHQPFASDLRWLVTVLKINGVMERIADLACNIAERAQSLDYYPLFPIPDELTVMVREVNNMVRQTLDAFIQSDPVLARHVIRLDDSVDALNRKLIDGLSEQMKEDSENVDPALHCFSATRHLERIADLAEHLCEDIIYMVEGEIVRHKHELQDADSAEMSS